MPGYNFKDITVVPSSSDFIDIVLSTTQRTTPTVVRKGWNITRIRSFYMRKVRYTKQTWCERLTSILEEFPRVDDVHPFYGDLMNVLYDKDHYKLALGQLSTAKTLISKVGQDYVRLLKYGDSLYRCKQLKRAALGRMCTLMKKQGPALSYLEQVRQHLSRLPSIDPNTRTLIVCGYPNVGKSSFMNRITRADVEVQPYAFTTKSLFVGHTDYKYLRWQVVDTPGILDRPLEERNTIEMQSVTALAHLRASVLYLVDVSEACGYTLKQQLELLKSIAPLFANKPLTVVFNKIDIAPIASLGEDNIATLREIAAVAKTAGMRAEAAEEMLLGEQGIEKEGRDEIVDSLNVLSMSALKDEHVSDVRKCACEKLLSARVELKLRGKKASTILNRVHVATPKRRDGVNRPPVIPQGVVKSRASESPRSIRRTEKDLEREHGGAGVYSADFRKNYLLQNDDWRYDIIPEVVDGKNVADFVDPEIDAKLAELEREEDELLKEAEIEDKYRAAIDEAEKLGEEDEALLHAIERRKGFLVDQHRKKKAGARNYAITPRTSRARTLSTSDMREQLGSMGIDTELAEKRAVEEAASGQGSRKRSRSTSRPIENDVNGEIDPENKKKKKTAAVLPGLRDADMRTKAVKAAWRASKKRNKNGYAGESDR